MNELTQEWIIKNGLFARSSIRTEESIKELLMKEKFAKAIEKIDGDYAVIHYDGKLIYACRDIFGVMPLFYSLSNKIEFGFLKTDIQNPIELNPREILIYDAKIEKISFIKRKFFKISPLIPDSEEEITKNLARLFFKSIEKRKSKKKTGVLFSGGIDSTLIAFLLKTRGIDFCCYTAGMVEDGYAIPDDISVSKIIAKRLGLVQKTAEIKLNEVEDAIKEIIKIISEPDVVKISVALPFYFACRLAERDNVKIIFSGLGSEELFAGYLRHKKSANVNKECISGLKKMHERDTYRDYAVTQHFGMNCVVPFLDKDLAEYSLRIPAEFKIKNDIEKYIIRKTALQLGLFEEFVWRKKKAAQYGSRFMNAIEILSRKNKFKTKKEYIKSLMD